MPGGSTRVQTRLDPAADFTIDTLTAKRSPDGSALVSAVVHNTGGRALDMNGTLKLVDGPGGLSAGPFPATLGTTRAIGATEPVEITLDKRLPAGPWDAQITLKSGLVERTTTATLTFPAHGAAAASATKTETPRPGWVYPAIAGAVLLLVLGIVLLVLRRRRRRPEVVEVRLPGPLKPLVG